MIVNYYYTTKYPIDEEEYYKDLRERQENHLKRVMGNRLPFRPCMHDNCPQCCGTGVRIDGSPCIHMISCPCPKCNPFYL